MIFVMWDYVSLFYFESGMARSRASDRCELRCLISAPHFHLSEGGTPQHLNGQQFVLLNGSILDVHLSYNGQDLKSHLRIWDVDSRSYERDLATLLIHKRSGDISVPHLRSNESNLMAMICIEAFHLSHWLKMKSQIQQSRPIYPVNTHVLQQCKAFKGVLSNQIISTSQFSNLLFSSSSRLILVSKEYLKERFCGEWQSESTRSF